MNQPMDVFSWLNDASAQFDESEPHPFTLLNKIARGMDTNDLETVRSCRLEFERLADTYSAPWLGVFGRHWELQYRLTKNREGATAIADTVSAFELSHREDTIECPQSMCTTQDLCIVYSNVDGPGYAEETLAASKDGLARIDSSWPCWDRLSAELVTGLGFSGDHAGAVEQCVEIESELRSAGASPSVNYASQRLRSLIDADLLEGAIDFDGSLVRQRYTPHSDDAWPLYDCVRSRLLLRIDDAAGALDGYRLVDPIEKPSFGDDWRVLARELIEAGELANDDEFSSIIVRLGQHFARVGAWRRAFNSFADAGEFAAQRGALASAERCRAKCEMLATELAKPIDAPERLARLDTVIASAPKEISDLSPMEQEIDSLEASLDNEFDIAAFTKLATLLEAQGWGEVAEARLSEQVKQDPGNEASSMLMMQLLFSSKDTDTDERLTELASVVSAEDASLSAWIRANTAFRSERWEDVIAQCQIVVDDKPEAKNARRLWFEALRKLDRNDEAADVHLEMVALDHDDHVSEEEAIEIDRTDNWAGIVVGSLAQRWEVVREAAARLNIELVGKAGPVDETWESCKILFRDPKSGVTEVLKAERTGPATARIVQLGYPQRQTRFHDVVVFDPEPCNQLADDASDHRRATFVFEYSAIETMQSGNCATFQIEGPSTHSFEDWEVLRDGLTDAGFGVAWLNLGDEHHRELNEVVEIFNCSVAVPPEKSAKELVEHLTTATESWSAKLAWPGLAKAADIDADYHRNLIDNMWGHAEEAE